jgi:hypothetical protein
MTARVEIEASYFLVMENSPGDLHVRGNSEIALGLNGLKPLPEIFVIIMPRRILFTFFGPNLWQPRLSKRSTEFSRVPI